MGTQYRSAIYCHSPEQHAAALGSREEGQEQLLDSIVTEIEPAAKFWRARNISRSAELQFAASRRRHLKARSRALRPAFAAPHPNIGGLCTV